jgi:exonuclease VII small subunit
LSPPNCPQFIFEQGQPPRSDGDPLDQSGQAIVALLQQAATLSNESCDRAMGLARKLSLQLHAAEGRIDQLQAGIKQCQDRAERAEKWLNRIYQEIEEKLIRSRQ